MSAGNTPQFVEIDFYVRHRHLERSAVKPAAAEGHGQRLHVAQQPVDIRGYLFRPLGRFSQKVVDFFVVETMIATNGSGTRLDGNADPLGSHLNKNRFGIANPFRLEAGQIV